MELQIPPGRPVQGDRFQQWLRRNRKIKLPTELLEMLWHVQGERMDPSLSDTIRALLLAQLRKRPEIISHDMKPEKRLEVP